MKFNPILFLFLGFFIYNPQLNAQKLIDDTKTLKVLVFEHEQKDKTKLISQTGRIKYKLRNDPKTVRKGTIDDIMDNSMIVDGQEIAFTDCLMIGGRVSSEEILVGGVLIGTGFTGLVMAGGIAIAVAPLGGMVAIMVGGVVAIGVGIYLVSKIKRFNLDKGWVVHGGKITYSLTD